MSVTDGVALLGASERECVDLIERLEGYEYGDFTVLFDVVIDAPSGEFYVVVHAINTKDPESSALPLIEVSPGWIVSDFWYAAQAAGAHLGSIMKEP